MVAFEHLDRLSQMIHAKVTNSSRLLVAVAGPPGAGKSTLADALAKHLNQHLHGAALVVPMDGFHYDNAILMERGLLARKGAPETFDADGFVALIHRLRDAAGEIAIPVFDREQDLSRASARLVSRRHRVLVVEGNYLLLKRKPWSDLMALWDVSVFLSPKLTTIEQRLIQRWLDHGLEELAAMERARGNDLANAKIVLEESQAASIII